MTDILTAEMFPFVLEQMLSSTTTDTVDINSLIAGMDFLPEVQKASPVTERNAGSVLPAPTLDSVGEEESELAPADAVQKTLDALPGLREDIRTARSLLNENLAELYRAVGIDDRPPDYRSYLRDEKVKVEQLRKEKNITSCPHFDSSRGAESHPDIRAWKAVEKVSHCVNAQLSLGLEIHDTLQGLRSAYIRIKHQTEVTPHPRKGVKNPCSTQRRQSLPAPKDLLKSVMVASGIIGNTSPLRQKEHHQPSTSVKGSETQPPGSSLRKTYPVYDKLGLDSRNKNDNLAAAVSGSDRLRIERSEADPAAPSDPLGKDDHVALDMPSSSGNVERDAAVELHPIEDFDEFFKEVLNPAPVGVPNLYPELDALLTEPENPEFGAPLCSISTPAETASTATPVEDTDPVSASSSFRSPCVLTRISPLETTNLHAPAKSKRKPGRQPKRDRKAVSPEAGSREVSEGQDKARVPKPRRHTSSEKKDSLDVITLSSGEESSHSNSNAPKRTRHPYKRRKVDEETRSETPVTASDSREDTPVTDDTEPSISRRLKSRKIQEQAQKPHKREKLKEETREVTPLTSLDSREGTPPTDESEPSISRRLKSRKIQEEAEKHYKRRRPEKGTQPDPLGSDDVSSTSSGSKFTISKPTKVPGPRLKVVKAVWNIQDEADFPADDSGSKMMFRVAMDLARGWSVKDQ